MNDQDPLLHALRQEVRTRRESLSTPEDAHLVRAAIALQRHFPARVSLWPVLAATGVVAGIGIVAWLPLREKPPVVTKGDKSSAIPPKPDLIERKDSPLSQIATQKERPTLRPLGIPTKPKNGAPQHDDLEELNQEGTDGFIHRFGYLTPTQSETLARALARSTKGDGDFLTPPTLQLAGLSKAALASALAPSQVVDPRLQKRVSLAVKGEAFNDLCTRLTRETGIVLTASRTVADDKVTIFCKDKPLRELMRDLNGLFGFTWDRSGSEGEWTYRLTQPLRSQLLEEELRNKDRDEALLDLDRQLQDLKELLTLSPEALYARSQAAEESAKERLQNLATLGWGPLQLYNQLGSQELAALRSGTILQWGNSSKTDDTGEPGHAGQLPLPESLAQSIRNAFSPIMRVKRGDDGKWGISVGSASGLAKFGGQSPAQMAEFEPVAQLSIERDELGRFSLNTTSGGTVGDSNFRLGFPVAMGQSPSTRTPDNAKANAARAKEPGMQQSVTLPTLDAKAKRQITTADILELLHQQTGKDVIGDYFTRLVHREVALPAGKRSLFEVLNKASDTARFRWSERQGTLSFRSAGFFNDRLKEVPSRLLEPWKARHESQEVTGQLANILEIVRLSDTQLDSSEVAEGIEALYGLTEWPLARYRRKHWRLFESLSKPERDQALREGLLFSELTPRAKTEFLNLLMDYRKVQQTLLNPERLAQLNGARLKVVFNPETGEKGSRAQFIYQYPLDATKWQEVTYGDGGYLDGHSFTPTR